MLIKINIVRLMNRIKVYMRVIGGLLEKDYLIVNDRFFDESGDF